MATYGTDLANIALGDGSDSGSWTEFTPYALGGTPALDGENYIQGVNCISQTTGTKSGLSLSVCYNYGSDLSGSLSAGDCIFIWSFYAVGPNLETYTNGGLRVGIGSTTSNISSYSVGGRDYGRNPYGGWQNVVIDPTRTGDYLDSGGNGGAYQYIGTIPYTLAAISKGTPHAVDAIRYGRGEIYCTGTACTFAGMSQYNDYNDATNGYNRFGLFQDNGGTYLWKGLMSFGQTATSATFSDQNKTIIVDAAPKTYAAFNKIEVNNASTSVTLSNVSFTALGTLARGNFEAIANSTINLTGCTFSEMGTFIFQSNSTVASSFIRCNQVTQGGAAIDGSTFTSSTATNCIYVSNLNNIDNCIFSRPVYTTTVYDESNQDAGTNMYSGSTVGVSQSFPGESRNFYQCMFYLKKTGSPTGNATAYLYAHSGTYGTSSVPTGTALATSATFDVSTLTTSYQLISFTFSTQYKMASGTNYTVAVQYSGGSGTDYITVGTDTSSPTHGGNAATFNGASWSASSTTDAIFYVNTNHAIELSSAHAGNTYTLTNCDYTNYYSTSPGSNPTPSSGSPNACIYNNSGGAVTINVSGGDTPTIRNGASATTTVVTSVAVTVTIQDSAGNGIPGAEVAIFQDNASRTVVQASTSTNSSGEVATSAAQNLGDILIRVRQSDDQATASFLTSESGSNGVESSTETIHFNGTPHNFVDGQAVVYSRNGGSVDIGPEPGTYYVNQIDSDSLQLYDTAENAVTGGATGRQNLTASGSETHTLVNVRYVPNSATGTIGSSAFSAQITMVTDNIVTG